MIFLFPLGHFLSRTERKQKKMEKRLNKNFKKKFISPNLHQAKSGVISFLVAMVGGGRGGMSRVEKSKLLRMA